MSRWFPSLRSKTKCFFQFLACHATLQYVVKLLGVDIHGGSAAKMGSNRGKSFENLTLMANTNDTLMLLVHLSLSG